jgi:hypothetical protein
MTRNELEQAAYEIIAASMQYNGMDEEIWKEIKAASDEDLLAYIEE